MWGHFLTSFVLYHSRKKAFISARLVPYNSSWKLRNFENLSNKSDEIFRRWRKFCPTKNYIRRKFCPIKLPSSGCFTWQKWRQDVKVTKILSDIVLSDGTAKIQYARPNPNQLNKIHWKRFPIYNNTINPLSARPHSEKSLFTYLNSRFLTIGLT